MDLTTLMHYITSNHGWQMVTDPDGDHRVEVPTEPGRSQVVQITPGHDPDNHPLVWIWSVVCKTDAVGDPWFLLKQNAELPYGGFAVRGDQVMLVETQLLESADPDEMIRAIFFVAQNADKFEKMAYGATVDNA